MTRTCTQLFSPALCITSCHTSWASLGHLCWQSCWTVRVSKAIGTFLDWPSLGVTRGLLIDLGPAYLPSGFYWVGPSPRELITISEASKVLAKWRYFHDCGVITCVNSAHSIVKNLEIQKNNESHKFYRTKIITC